MEGGLLPPVRGSWSFARSLVRPNSHSEGSSADGLRNLLALEGKDWVWVKSSLEVAQAELTVRILAPGPQETVLVFGDAE